MNVLYCHDNVYFHSEMGDIYSSGQFPYSYFVPFIEAFGNVTVIGRGQYLNKDRDIKKLNVCLGPAIDFALMPNINSICGLWKYYALVNEKLERLVSEADAVIIRAVSDIGWLAFHHAKKQNKPIAMEMSACAWDSTWNHGSPYGKLYAPVRYYRDKKMTAQASHVIYVSQHFLQKRYATQGVTAMASNVRIERPDPAFLVRRLEKIRSRGPDDFIVIGLIGTLGHKLKGIHTALQALKHMEHRRPAQFIFRILGPGNPEPYRAEAEALGLQDHVIFDGTIQTGEKVLDWLMNVDLYIQPSFQEGVPRATIEAMSRGCPVIGSTAGGIPELLPSRWLHKPGDYKRLASLMLEMLGDAGLQEQAAQENFEKSKAYASEILTPIRKKFWADFASYAQGRTRENAV